MEANNLKGYLSKLNQEKNSKQKRMRGKEKRLTIILSEYDFRRLKYISKILTTQTSVFAREIILEALSDAELIIGLSEFDIELTEFTNADGEQDFGHSQSDYGDYINAVGDDELSDDDFSEVAATSNDSLDKLKNKLLIIRNGNVNSTE